MTYVYGLPSDHRSYPAQRGYASRPSQPGSGLGLASLTAGGVALLTGLLPSASGASAGLTLTSVALGFAALGRAHRTTSAHRGRAGGWAGLLLELSVGALLIWSAVAFFTLLTAPALTAGPATGLPVLEQVGGTGPAAGCLRADGGHLICPASGNA
ncbi:hypothetical protein ACFOWE_19125 [Planomonospora corallina]|uniref:DUF4190 domain-containing protein n=1 Tax=Planomonospora corallina TaxID=1806052 RepID=A0ABV8I8N6_9ACTN